MENRKRKTLYSAENSAAHMQECWSGHPISTQVANLLLASVLFEVCLHFRPHPLYSSRCGSRGPGTLSCVSISERDICEMRLEGRQPSTRSRDTAPGPGLLYIVEFMTDTDWLPLGGLSCLRPALRNYFNRRIPSWLGRQRCGVGIGV